MAMSTRRQLKCAKANVDYGSGWLNVYDCRRTDGAVSPCPALSLSGCNDAGLPGALHDVAITPMGGYDKLMLGLADRLRQHCGLHRPYGGFSRPCTMTFFWCLIFLGPGLFSYSTTPLNIAGQKSRRSRSRARVGPIHKA